MILQFLELIAILLSALVGGMYWGPWLALTRSIASFDASTFLAIVDRLNSNMQPLMTALTPLALLSILPVLFLSFGTPTFYLTLIGFLLFILALIVTMLVEVPIVKQIITWRADSLPDNWQQLRDRWGAFHIIRVTSGIAGLGFLVAGAIF